MTDATPMQAYYAARAREYDQVYLKPERQQDLRAIEQWLAPRFTARRMLEVACGTGYWTQFIAPTAAQVLALDSSTETIEIARTRVPSDKVQFLTGDAYALPQSTPRCDGAFAGFWFSHVPRARWREFLLGLNAVLAPDAAVVLLDNRYVPGSSSPISEHDLQGNSYQNRALLDGTQHRLLKNFPSEPELLDLLHGLGLQGRYSAWPYYWALEYAVARP